MLKMAVFKVRNPPGGPKGFAMVHLRKIACVFLCAACSFSVVFLSGCASGELARKEQKIAELSQQWERAERQLSSAVARIAELRRALKAAQSEAATLRRKLATTTEALKKTQVEHTRLAAKVKGLEEKNYDLEMAYGSLTDQIVSLRRALAKSKEELARTKKDLQAAQTRMVEERRQHTKAVRSLEDRLKEATGRADSLQKKVEGLQARLQAVTAEKQSLARRAAQIPGLQRRIDQLTREKGNAEKALKKKEQELVSLRTQLEQVSVAARSAGVRVPEAVRKADDWTVLKRLAETRFEALKTGSLKWDRVDFLFLGAGFLVLFFLVNTLVMAVRLVRGRRGGEVAATTDAGGEGDLPEPEPEEEWTNELDRQLEPLEEEGPAAQEGDIEEATVRLKQAEVPKPPKPSAPPSMPQRQVQQPKPAQPSVRRKKPAPAPQAADDERTEILTPADILGALGGEGSPKKPAAPKTSAGTGKPKAEGAAPKEQLLDDLKKIINKKFDELLHG